MKLKTAIFSVAGALVILAGLLESPTARADTKIGVVNFTQLLQESPALKAAMESLKAEFGPRREELIKMQRDVKAHPNNEHLRQDFATQASEFQNRAMTSRSEATKKVADSITAAIAAYAQAEDIDLVVGGTPVFADPQLQASAQTLEITTKIQAFMAKLSTQPVVGPPPETASTEVRVGTIGGLSAEARSSVNIPRLQHYASQHGYALVVLDGLFYAKLRFKISDITTDAQFELEQY
jgi:Skp family chaperone for outer membrane proteins